MKHILFTLLTILWFPFSIACQIDFSHYRPGPQDDPAFLRADSAIRADAYGEVHSLLVVEKGKLVFERYYRDWTPDSLHQLQSATKSIVATLLGCALQQGLIPGVDQPISAYYPYIEGRDTLKNGIRIRDLLTQRHGLKWKEAPWDDPGNTWRKVLATEGNWFETILKTPMDTAPGARFNYSNAAPVLTTGIIQAASGMRIDSFADYQEHEAWTWEHMALTRARVISASPAFRARIEDIIRGVLTRVRDRRIIANDVAEMRRAIALEKGEDDIWDLKYASGGLVDIEFIAQYLQLVHAAEKPDILSVGTSQVLENATRLGILSQSTMEVLRPATRLYHDLTQVLRLCVSEKFKPDGAGYDLLRILTRAGDAPDFSALEARLRDTQTEVRGVFLRLLEDEV